MKPLGLLCVCHRTQDKVATQHNVINTHTQRRQQEEKRTGCQNLAPSMHSPCTYMPSPGYSVTASGSIIVEISVQTSIWSKGCSAVRAVTCRVVRIKEENARESAGVD